MSGRFFGTYSIILVISLLYLSSQNCIGSDPLEFSKNRESLVSRDAQTGGGGGYDGKPDPGNYCRVFDELKCQTQVDGLQSFLKVDQNGLHLLQDNCTSTSTNFRFGDAGVKHTPLLPNFVGVSRGIFKKCDLGRNNLPEPPTEMPDAYCVSNNQQFAAVINKNLRTSELDVTVGFNFGPGTRTVTANSLSKFVDAGGNITYSASRDEFDLSITKSNSQTSSGTMKIVVDDATMVVNLNCRTSSPEPTVIIENDMELSSTWINTSQLVGYWKLNEPNAREGTAIIDSSPFAASGTLLTGNDGLNKTDVSAKGGAIALDGNNDSVSIPRPADNHLEIGTGSFSYMIWIKKLGNLDSFDMPLYHGGGFVTNAGFDIECGTFCTAGISDGTGTQGTSNKAVSLTNNTTPWIGRWVLLVVVVDRSTQQLRGYVDGNLVATNNITTVGSIISNDEIRFGGIEDGRYPFFGSIDDVALWKRALSDAEVLEIFQRLRPKFY